MSIRQRGLRLLGLGVAFALALGLLAACGDDQPPQTIVNENVGERTEPETTQETVETTEETTEEETEAEETEEEAEEPVGADGKQIFTSAGCAACHTLSDAGAAGQVGPSFDEVSVDVDTAVETITNGRNAMPPFSGQLSEEEIQAVAEYVSESSKG